MARGRWLLVLLVGGVLAVVLTLLSRDPAPVETVHQSAPPDLQLISFDPQAVAGIVIRRHDGLELQLWRRPEPPSDPDDASETGIPDLARRFEGDMDPGMMEDPESVRMEWELTAPWTAGVDSDLVTAAVLELAELRAYRRVGLDAEDIDVADFGLDPPRVQLEIHLQPSAGAALVLWVGAPTPVMVGDHPTYYVQLPGQEEVFVAGGSGLALVDAAPEDLLPRPEASPDAAPAAAPVQD